MNQRKSYSADEINKITESVSVLDYFQYLEKQGKVQFDRKSGHDYYFRTDENKFSVNENGYYDFKTGQGGKIIKAVMNFENKSWRETMDFLKDFSNVYISEDFTERKRLKDTQSNEKSNISVTKIIPPNNDTLIEYFNNRGIDKDILEKYTKQIHYKVEDKSYFGLGIENQSNGYEIRNPMMKSKLGKNDIAIVNRENGKNIVVFEGMTDMLSFLQLQKLNNRENKSTLVVLNSVVNVDKFIEEFKDYKGKITLLLDGDKAGTDASTTILSSMPNHTIEDLRWKYSIGFTGTGIKDLNDYLQNREEIQSKKRNLVENKFIKNETNQEQSTGISDSQPVERGKTESDNRNLDKTSQSEHRNTNREPETLDSYNVGIRAFGKRKTTAK